MLIVKELKLELKEKSDPKAVTGESRFFKEKIKHYGIKTSEVGNISKKYYQKVKLLEKKEIFDLCEKLFSSGYMEESFIASDWTYRIRNKFTAPDFNYFQRWVDKYIDNWAKCDTFCNHTIGSFIEKYPKYIKNLKSWAKSKNLWVRRASAVSLIVPARKGLFLDEVFEICDILLLDREDMVQKGYGWLLKVSSDKHLSEVFDYVMKNKINMPRTSLRYAIEKMPAELKKKAMKK
ncbi:DNA alkylation repair protein [Patescibacteria group bacterium]|nr:DNA alkylation repair protein [Patescibacteria group bacterium]